MCDVLMPYYSPENDVVLEREKAAVRRAFYVRQLRCCLILLSLGNVLREEGHAYALMLLAVSSLLWPAAALLMASRSPHPLETESRHLLADAILTGLWVALSGLSPVPSVVIISVMVAELCITGGLALLRRCMPVFCVSLSVCWSLSGHPLMLQFSPLTVWFTLLPFSAYIIAVSIASRRQATESGARCLELEKLSLTDPGLGLPNRRMFDHKVHTMYSRSQAGHIRAYLMLIDIDFFKQMNDTFGHQAGDRLLISISALISSCLLPADIPARLGGDELAVIVADGDDLLVCALAQRIVEGVRTLSIVEAVHHRNSVSIGIARADDFASVSDWIAGADFALYSVKEQGKDSFQLFTAPERAY